jgi:hypothetical protein
MPDPNRGPHPEDLPWNDEPGDTLAWPSGQEPEPAEVDGAGRDHSHHVTDGSDLNRRDSLDQRLAAEEPDLPVRAARDTRGTSLQDGEHGEEDIEVAERDPDALFDAENDDLPAEEAAIHIESDRKI